MKTDITVEHKFKIGDVVFYIDEVRKERHCNLCKSRLGDSIKKVKKTGLKIIGISVCSMFTNKGDVPIISYRLDDHPGVLRYERELTLVKGKQKCQK